MLKSVVDQYMLYRKIAGYIEDYLCSDDDRILVLEGARQVGKSFIIRSIGQKVFDNFIEVNFVEDDMGAGLFKNVRTTEEFYLKLSSLSGAAMNNYNDTLVFLDEIQHYPQFLTLLKFFRQDHRYRFIASGSLLGIALRSTSSVPVGSIILKQMYQLDFEEFLIANDVGFDAIEAIRVSIRNRQSLQTEMHNYLMKLFRRYLLSGGMPDAVNEYIASRNIVKIRDIQASIIGLYKADASKYEQQAARNLLIRRIYDMIPSQMENKKKRIVAKEIRDRKGDRLLSYSDEFEYLISSGTVLDVHAVSNPKFPLSESMQKNLLKLYMNDVGLLTFQLYKNNIQPILEDDCGVNLGAVYESAVAQELKAHGYRLFYYDNKQKGEVDFMIDDYEQTSILPIEVKSGKDYTVHSALNNLLSVKDYNVKSAIVLSNAPDVTVSGNVAYLPVYGIMSFDAGAIPSGQDIII